MGHHTKDKGDIGIYKVIANLGEQGYSVFVPISEHLPFDLVVYDEENFYRIQVKYRSVVDGKIVVHFRSSWADKHGNHFSPMEKKNVDIVAIYCPDTDKTYYVDPDNFAGSVSLRIDLPAKGYEDRVHIANIFEQMPR